ncbi:MAG: hypothetical protein Q8O99_04985 [bacterium]|nr:hypothetical protein [bacterium]
MISTNYSGTIYTGSATPILGDTTGSVATALDDALNDGYDRAHTGSVVIDGDSVNGTFEYVCRIGDPYLECTQSDSCSESNYLQQSRTIAGDTWTDLDSITLPTEGTQ